MPTRASTTRFNYFCYDTCGRPCCGILRSSSFRCPGCLLSWWTGHRQPLRYQAHRGCRSHNANAHHAQPQPSMPWPRTTNRCPANEYNVRECTPDFITMSTHLDLSKNSHTYAASIPFRQRVGALLVIDRHTYPKIMRVAKFCTWYDMGYFLTALRILKYVCTKKHRKLTFMGGHDSSLHATQTRLTT